MSRILRHTIPTLAFALVSTPTFGLETAGKEVAIPKDETALSVSTRGVLVAGQSADISAGMTGRLTFTPFKTGQYFKRGATLAKFDCERQEAELQSRQAAHATQSLRYENQAELLKMGAAGELDVSIAKSERDQIAAEVSSLRIALKDCVVSAPFPGFITARHVDAYESVQAGQPLYSLNRAGTTEISIIAPSAWASWVKSGTKLTFKVDETSESVAAKVQRLSAIVDPVSQTIEITAQLTGKHSGRPGMSGIAVFEAP